MAQVDDFLKPESMMTPGVAGAITMTISNALWMQFGLQQRWSALVLSFALGALAVASARIPVWQRAVYCVFNSLIIFTAAAGGNYLGYQVSETTRTASLSEPPAYSVSWLRWPRLFTQQSRRLPYSLWMTAPAAEGHRSRLPRKRKLNGCGRKRKRKMRNSVACGKN